MVARLFASVGGNGSATSSVSVGTFFDSVTMCSGLAGTCDSPAEKLIATNLDFYAGQIMNVRLGAGTLIYAGSDGVTTSSDANVFTDPVFEVDPSFQYRDLFSFDYSPNLFAATAPIPEPETYAMLIVGLAFLGFRARRSATLI
jgi:hypothetical protein